MTLRMGLLGSGCMGLARGLAMARLDGVAVTAVHSRRSESAAALAGNLGAACLGELDEFLAAVDAVVVAVPNALHERFAAAALEAGRHVLVEYPLATSLAAAERLQRLAEQHDRVLMVGNTIVHEAIFRYVASHVVFARVEARPSEDPDRLALNGGTLVMGHAEGATSCVQWYLGAEGDALPRGLWLTGDRGSVTVVAHRFGWSQVIWGGGGPGQVEEIEDDWGVAGSSAEFVAAIRGECHHRAALASDLRTLEVALAAARSADERRPVTV
ncbi:MAG: Gfo/Idh/MocA family oxidoreductase [Armatimonadetes bacterium]|nr:Gfo/Idh/MocA family oxidoreductase [Armatimonadota bacterium]